MGGLNDIPAEKLAMWVSRREMAEILGTGDRAQLRDWLGCQRVEGPGVSMSLAEFIWEVGREIGELQGAEQARRATQLEVRLLGLAVRYNDNREPGAVRTCLGDALRTHDTFELLFRNQPWYDGLIKNASSSAWPKYWLRLEHRRYKKPDEPWTINPGRIGPNFVHTWALDLVNVSGFRIGRNKPNDIALYSTTWAGMFCEDRLTVVDSCNRVLQTFTSDDFFIYGKVVDLEHRPPCPPDQPRHPFTRIYLILETSRDPAIGASRWFQLEELELLSPLFGAEHAYVVADEINYDYFDSSIQPPNNDDFVEALDAQGHIVQITPPWAGGPEGANSKLPAELKTKPSRERGWYLLGLNTTYTDQKFYSVVYYNERLALLRVYLYSLDEDSEFTAHVIKLCFEGCTDITEEPQSDPELPPKYLPQWNPLHGAFFPVDANPKNWWRAELAVGGWSFHTWTAIEVPVLYPMGSDLPAVGQYAVGDYTMGGNMVPVGAPDLASERACANVALYRSMYEDEFAAHQRNVRLVVSVRTFHKGWADLDLVGKALGEAVQKADPEGLIRLTDAVKTGADWYGYAQAYGKVVSEATKKNLKGATGAAKASGEEFLDKIGNSFTIIGAIAAVTGFLLRAYGVLSSDVLALNIVLALQGKVSGALQFEDMERQNRFYLPGRFSIADAFSVDGIATQDIRASIDSCLPRYDRTLGLFGYAYAPWKAEVNVNAMFHRLLPKPAKMASEHPVPSPAEDVFFFPARHELMVSPPWGQHLGHYAYEPRLMPDLLPVVVNPRAEIHLIPAIEADIVEYVAGSYQFIDGLPYDLKFMVKSSRIYLAAADRAQTKSFGDIWQWYGVMPMSYQVRGSENQQGYTSLRVNVTGTERPVVQTSLVPLTPRHFRTRRGVRVDRSYCVIYNLQDYEPLDMTSHAPMLLTDIIYCWRVTYVYWGETRAPIGKAHPQVEEMMLSVPVTMRIASPGPMCEPRTPDFGEFVKWLAGTPLEGPLADPQAWKTFQDWWTAIWEKFLDWWEDYLAGNPVESSLLR